MFTLFPAFKYGWQEMHKKIWAFLLFTLLFSAADIASSYFMKDIAIDESMSFLQIAESFSPDFLMMLVLLSVAMIIINFFVVTFVLAGLRGVQPMTYLRLKIKLFPKYLLLMLLKMLAIGVGIMLFVIPGLLILLALYLVEYLLIDRDMPVLDTFKESWNLTKGFRTGIFFFEVNLFIIGMFLAFPQNLWPDTVLTYAILALMNVVWLPFSWNAQGWIYQFVSSSQIEK